MLQAFARGLPGHPDEHTETLLALGLFTADRLTTRVTDLSTGQRQRLSLARLLSRPSDVLLLDEPTNHLSPSLIEDVEQALADYPGTILLVSHDRRLRTRWTGTHLPSHSTHRLIPGERERRTAPGLSGSDTCANVYDPAPADDAGSFWTRAATRTCTV